MAKRKYNAYKYAEFMIAIILVLVIAALSYNIVYKPKMFAAPLSASSSIPTTASVTTISITSTIPPTASSTTMQSTTSTYQTTIYTTIPSTTSYTTTIFTSTTSTSITTTIAPPQNQTNQTTTFIVIPNSNERGSRFTYIPIATNNTANVDFICKYFPVGYQNPSYLNGTYGKNFSSIYTLQGQLQVSNLGQSLDVSNATYATYNFGVACN
jgi:hypothetical protein